MSVMKVAIAIMVLAFSLCLAGPALCEEPDGAGINVTIQKAAGKISVVVPAFVKETDFIDREGRDVKMADILADDLVYVVQQRR